MSKLHFLLLLSAVDICESSDVQIGQNGRIRSPIDYNNNDDGVKYPDNKHCTMTLTVEGNEVSGRMC